MNEGRDYDVIVMGGGLAGLCLSIQLKQLLPGRRVLVFERGRSPRPEAAHKVGESSVEVASHYFRNVIKVEDLMAREIPKFGLRFFMTQGENRDIAQRLEIGPKNYLTMPSDQIDRGQFENGLAERALELGVEIESEAKVTDVELGTEGADHALEFVKDENKVRARTRWIVDASGRTAVLKKKLGIARSSRHAVNASWFRIDDVIDVDNWSADPAFGHRADESRRCSTNHLMGEGYWVWIIPLAHGRTSVGIVADAAIHPFTEINTFERSLVWLEEHEPQFAAIVREHEEAGRRMDFLALKKYAQDAKQVFSPERWALTGDAGIFIDPLYSPGSDFIAISNGFITDLVDRDLRGESIELGSKVYDRAYRSLTQTYLVTYYRQYPLMGNARVMITKFVWDFAMYWGGVALLFCGDRMCNPAFMERANPILQSFAFTNVAMQAYFREWARASAEEPPPERVYIDYAGLDFLAELNSNLREQLDDDALIERMERNLNLSRSLRREIYIEASRANPSLAREDASPLTAHLDKMFEAMRAAQPSERS